MAAVPQSTTNTLPTLASMVKTSIARKPLRVVLYAPEKTGKTTFAARAPSPIFLGTEDGFGDITPTPPIHDPSSWTDALTFLRVLRSEQHDYKTLIIDTVDFLEPLCWEHVCKREGVDSIEKIGGGYGKGHLAAQLEWRNLLADLDRLRAKGMTIILLAHSKTHTFQNPDGEDYSRYTLAMNEKSAGLIKQWADIVLFANFETFVDIEKGQKKGKGLGGQTRKLYTQRRASFDAGNRFSLPEEMPLAWDEFDAAMKAGAQRIADLKTQIVASLGDNADPKLVAWVDSTADAGKLAEALNRLQAKASAQQTTPATPANGGAA
jgi:hypothetical protein